MRTILHCDVNNFYASVEAVKNPALKGLPIAVCGNPEKRHGIILAKSYPAKARGIKTGDTIWEAKQKCPDLLLLPADFNSYMDYSDRIFEIYTRFTDMVEPYGLDECWLDVTGSVHLFGNGREIADLLRKTVYNETGVTISVGVSFTKSFAKLGSDMKKPNATTEILHHSFREKIWHLPAEELIMVGPKTASKLKKLNINTIGDLALADPSLMKKIFGIVGLQLVNSANGIEDTAVRMYYDKIVPKSVGHSTTTPRDMTTRDELKAVVFSLSDQVAYRLRRLGLKARGVSLYVRNKKLEFSGRQISLPSVTSNGRDIGSTAMRLFDSEFNIDTPLRLAGVSAFNLIRATDLNQISFFDREIALKARLDDSLDYLKEKYGHNIIRRGIVMTDLDLTDIFSDREFLPFKR
ncbi:MAG: DNA polymerase Y family protein [Christensenellales bacterium]